MSSTPMRWGAIVVAAGKGRRFGRPKQLVDLAGRPVAGWSLHVIAGMPEIATTAVVIEESEQAAFAPVLEATMRGRRAFLVPGGATRQASVFAGLRALAGEVDAVLVHDGARPLVRAEDIRRCMRPVAPGHAAILAAPVVDTIKAVDERGHVRKTFDRSTLWAAQTPQCATYADLDHAYHAADREAYAATDDASVLERYGTGVVVVPGSTENLKITTPGDLALAQTIIRERTPILPSEESMYLMEAFLSGNVLSAMIGEIEAGGGDIDGIDRELPQCVALRAYIPGASLERFRARFHLIAGHDATYTTRFSHGVSRT